MLRRRRTVAAGAFLASTVGGLIAVQAALGAGGGPLTTTGPPGGGVPAAPHVWVVKPGDTLWAIAEALRPGTDVRPLVDRLASEAGGRPLQAGQRLVEP